ncbi:hypothetical protein GCM10009854_44350 [Saccharopolyspora halophila]|uniref:DUF2795 domain-containing protein n=1 Tax=Saccharopolyspora halophila TaxID=405551 RepID=A0ABP5TSB6_9PSEU
MTDSDERRVAKALQGAEFPAGKQYLLDYARARGAGPKTVQALEALPERTYGNSDEVEQAVPQEPDKATGRPESGATVLPITVPRARPLRPTVIGKTVTPRDGTPESPVRPWVRRTGVRVGRGRGGEVGHGVVSGLARCSGSRVRGPARRPARLVSS